MTNYSGLTLYEIMKQEHGCKRTSPCGINIRRLKPDEDLKPTEQFLIFAPTKTKWVISGLKVPVSYIKPCQHVFQWHKLPRTLITNQDQLK